jgi:hypothetical protein
MNGISDTINTAVRFFLKWQHAQTLIPSLQRYQVNKLWTSRGGNNSLFQFREEYTHKFCTCMGQQVRARTAGERIEGGTPAHTNFPTEKPTAAATKPNRSPHQAHTPTHKNNTPGLDPTPLPHLPSRGFVVDNEEVLQPIIHNILYPFRISP